MCSSAACWRWWAGWPGTPPARFSGCTLRSARCPAPRSTRCSPLRGALAATFSVTRFRFGKPDASLCANGWLAGLVASSACAAIVSPAASLFIGGVAGIFTPLLVEVLELAVSIDDPSGAITVHGAAGLWGLLAAGIFAPQPGQLLAQLVGIAALLGVVLPLVYLLFACSIA